MAKENNISTNVNSINTASTLEVDNKILDEKEKLIDSKLKELDEKLKLIDVKTKELDDKSKEIDNKSQEIEYKLREIPKEELIEDSLSVGEELSKEPKISLVIPISELNPFDKIVPVTINGYTFTIKRGEEVSVPKTVYKILKEAKYI